MKFNKNFESWHTGCLIILVCKKNRKRNCGQLEKNWPNALRKTLAHCGLKIKIKQNRF